MRKIRGVRRGFKRRSLERAKKRLQAEITELQVEVGDLLPTEESRAVLLGQIKSKNDELAGVYKRLGQLGKDD